MRRLAVTVLAIAALVAPGSASAAVTPAACPPDVSGARCGAVAVPLDPADPATGTLGVRFELYRGPGLTLRDRRAIAAAASTVLDLVPRWLTMAGYEGVGLRGGAFSTDGWEVATFRLDRLRWVKDVAVSGRAAWDRRTGAIRAAVTLSGPATAPGRLTLRWNELDPDGVARATGELGGRRVDVVFPAP